MPDSPSTEFQRLKCLHLSGYNGDVIGGIRTHPDESHIVYPVGCNVVIEDIKTHEKELLWGHDNAVTCIAVSHSGQYLASGQVTHMGFKAKIIVWDFVTKSVYCKLVLHQVKVEALAFSPNDEFLISLGGCDDGTIVVWNIPNKEAICGAPAQVESAGSTRCIAYANNNNFLFASGGERTLRIWTLDVANRKIRPENVNTGQKTRDILSLAISEDDSTMYCGTSTGDVMAINMITNILKDIGPKKDMLCQGIRALVLVKHDQILVGSGDGTVAVLNVGCKDAWKRRNCAKVDGGVTALALRGKGHQFFVGTTISNVYKFTYNDFNCELYKTAHKTAIKDVSFTAYSPELFITCGYEDVKVWHTKTGEELLRINIPNMTCNAVVIPKDGKCIITGWNDSTIKLFYPESGKLMHTITDAVGGEVTALCVSDCGRKIICGGGNGEVRIWYLERGAYDAKGRQCILPKLKNSLKEHKGAITCIKMYACETECISASEDGTWIIWDLQKGTRLHMGKSNTQFKFVAPHPSESQFLTCGTDRKICYNTSNGFDSHLIREVEGAQSGAINGMDVSQSVDNAFFVSTGEDQLVKVWDYTRGVVKALGVGHSSTVQRAKISPEEKYIVSVADDGGICVWDCPRMSSS